MRFLLSVLLPFLALPAQASITTHICTGQVKAFYLDWDGSRYTVNKTSTITVNVDDSGEGYVMIDLGREPLIYRGPLSLDGSHDHAVTLREGDHLYFNLRFGSSHTLTFSARFTNRNNVISSGVYPSTVDCH